MHKKLKKIMAGAMSLATLAASTTVISPMAAETTVQVLGESTFEEKSLPWHVTEAPPAKQEFEVNDGAFHITVRVPQGADKEKWDLQFRHRGLSFKKGHEYKVSFKAKSKREGMELSSFIGTITDSDEYFVLDGNTNDMHMGPHMDGSWPATAVKLQTEWQTYEGIFTPTEDLDGCQWTFQYARGTKYQGNAIEGDELWFDDMSIECLTCAEDPANATCGWPESNNIGIIKAKNNVRLNQMGYYPNSDKKATYVTTKDKKAMDFKVVDKDGKTVYTGKTVPADYDEMAGEYCHIIDFSKVKTEGTYTIAVDDKDNESMSTSHEFTIGNDVYKGLLRNALNYYYQKRSGADTEEKYITSGEKNKLAHMDWSNEDLAYVQKFTHKNYSLSSYYGNIDTNIKLNVSGGWYDPETYSKTVATGGTAVWLLQNMYESSKKNGKDGKWADGKTMTIPDKYKLSGGNEVNCTATPDVLDEARYELEFMFRMIVDPEKDTIFGEDYADFVYDQVRESRYVPIAYTPLDYINENEEYGKSPRIINPPSYRATFNMIACAAQAARLWKGIDDDFADECLEHAKKSWAAILKYKEKFNIDNDKYYYRDESDPLFTPFVSYSDPNSYNDIVQDEAYWAACELFATTGDEAYYNYLKDFKSTVTSDETKQCCAFGVPNYLPLGYDSEGVFSSFDRNNKIGCGTISLYLSDKTSAADKAKIKENLQATADMYLDFENDTKNGAMGVPYKKVQWLDYYTYPNEIFAGYDQGSNSRITNNAIIMAYAYDATGDSKYLNGAMQAIDYIFGRNAMGLSYVTGCGSYHTKNPVDQYWGYELDKTLPQAPDGVMAGGPYTWLADDYVKGIGLNPDKTPPQKCYADSIEAWSVNATDLDWQAGLIWNISFFEDIAAKTPEVTTTTPTTGTSSTTTTTTTTVTSTSSVTTSDTKLGYKGDANCDGEMDMGDVVLVMQALANPNKYGEKGTDEHHITAEGAANADLNGDGLTVGDAQAIQKLLLGLS
ncbi:glycoside hydrolase family 9 protein [Ruminococcus flavefaciens]|uniref:Carbohydrate binding domain-containing protein n=1 Tax=Ruminococcus flavefaciens TaxID=1265 RepID=A0A1M7JM89_RUMFL|nr:glycoside hydrolase family 9 protein [Ruminococcus flavefaciens]SHM54152.1 Carbohydrate binding domain-containing protein [Ruminococcus flavefaciens]